MTEQLDFSLPGRGQEAGPPRSGLLTVILVLVLLGVLINMGFLLVQQKGSGKSDVGASLSANRQKELALKLEKQGLNMASVSAWKEYLKNASLGREDVARVWYRIGKQYQDGSHYEMALDAFYRSEGFATPQDISMEISRRTQECLEKMGKFAALRYELADRVGADPTTSDSESGTENDPVVAEIGPQKIRKSELDRRIEYLIDVQLSRLAPYLPEEQYNQKKEVLLGQYAGNNQRLVFLNQYIMEEILYRKARELKLADEAQVRTELQDLERSLLAGRVMDRQLAQEIKITPGDLETYYEANKENYIQPERAKISHILVNEKQVAEEVRKSLMTGSDFATIALKKSQDFSTRESGGEISQWIENKNGFSLPDLGNTKDALRVIFMTDEGRVAKEDVSSEKGIHIIKVLKREPERQKRFDEVKSEVLMALRSQKEREVQQTLLNRLRQEYDVVIHHGALSGNEQPSGASKAETEKDQVSP